MTPADLQQLNGSYARFLRLCKQDQAKQLAYADEQELHGLIDLCEHLGLDMTDVTTCS